MTASIFSQIAAAGQPVPTTAPAAQPPAVAWPPPVAAAPAPVAPPQAATQPPAWLAQQAAPPAVQTSPLPQVAAPASVASPQPVPASMAPPAWLMPAPPVAQVAPTSVAQVVQQTEAPAKRTRRTRAEIQAASMAQQPVDVAPASTAVDVEPEVYHAHATAQATVVTSKLVEPDEREAHVWDVLSALAMNPSLAALPAVDLADRALAIVVAGEKALGGS